ncbi:MAG: hypothetical protein WCF23_10015 [Candidatus Nitrosopolaris sp.]
MDDKVTSFCEHCGFKVTFAEDVEAKAQKPKVKPNKQATVTTN